MSAQTSIEWTRGDDGKRGATWNPVTGCTVLSEGCANCYAQTIAERFRGTPGHYYENGFDLQLRLDKLMEPLHWRRPRRVFVNSMSDLFHKDVPDEYIAKVFAVMAVAEKHTFQLLTKRHGRMRSLLSDDNFQSAVAHELLGLTFPGELPRQVGDVVEWWPLRNVHLIVSVENQFWAETRIRALMETPAWVRGISVEPMLGPITLYQHWLHPVMREGADPAVGRRIGKANGVGFIDWVICGGESGHGARPMNPRWARHLRDQCVAANVPFFYKQHGNWEPAPWKLERQPDEFTLDYKRRSEASGATHAFTGGMYQDCTGAWVENFRELTHKPWSIERSPEKPDGSEGMRRVNKKAAVAELDGQVWAQHPEEVMA